MNKTRGELLQIIFTITGLIGIISSQIFNQDWIMMTGLCSIVISISIFAVEELIIKNIDVSNNDAVEKEGEEK